MRGEVPVVERVVVCLTDGDESRSVTLIEGADLTLLEHSEGPVTEVAYGSREHTHKMVFGRKACAEVLDVSEEQAVEALVALFEDGERAQGLSDVMDRFDVAGAHYAYVAWSNAGDVALRRDVESGNAV